jgi:hypothetical protein
MTSTNSFRTYNGLTSISVSTFSLLLALIFSPALVYGKTTSGATPSIKVLEESFNDEVADDWEAISQTFDVKESAYRSFMINSLARTVVGDNTWKDYAISARIRVDAFDTSKPFGGVGLITMYQDIDHHYLFSCEKSSKEANAPMVLRIKKKWTNPETNSVEVTPLATKKFNLKKEKWYEFEARVVEGRLSFLIDGKLMLSSEDQTHTHGKAGLVSVYADSGFDDIMVQATHPLAKDNVIESAIAKVPYDGTLIYMEDFEERGDDSFQLINGGWKVIKDSAQNHALAGNIHYNLSRAVVYPEHVADGKIETKIKVVGWNPQNNGFGWTGIIARYQDPANYYEFTYDQLRKELLIRRLADSKVDIIASTPYELSTKRWVQFSAIMEGSTLELYVNGTKELSVKDDAHQSGGVGVINVYGDARVDDLMIYRRDGTTSGHPAPPAMDFEAFKPGDVFREFRWAGPYYKDDDYQHANDPKNKLKDARHFLVPIHDSSGNGEVVEYRNPINEIQIDHLKGAKDAEITLEAWAGHSGTVGKKLRINEHEWIPVESPDSVGDKLFRKEAYDHFYYPTIRVPLAHLREGLNTFQFESGQQAVLRFGWGQWGVVSSVFRIYYDKSQSQETGQVMVMHTGKNDALKLSFETLPSNSDIVQVDFIGCYEDFDIDGDGIYREWQYHYDKGILTGHVGSAKKAPFTVNWNTEWIPDQDAPMHFIARVRYKDGTIRVTPISEPFNWQRTQSSVKLYKPFDSPANWKGRGGAIHSNKLIIPDAISEATDAKLLVRSFYGAAGSEIGVNGKPIAKAFGKMGAYAYEEFSVPTSHLKTGLNKPYTMAYTADEGMTIMWPGIGIKARYATKN